MRIFVFLLVVCAARAAPQYGYNYQIQTDSSLKNDLSHEQYQLLQQYAQQQQQFNQKDQFQQQTQVQQPNIPQQSQINQIVEAPLQTNLQNPEQFVQKTDHAAIVEGVQQYPNIQQQKEEHQPIVQPRYQPTQQPAIQYNKEFFYLSAPQENFELPQDFDKQLESLRKNIRVIFIRAPEHNGLENAALQLVKQSVDQQTVVYVLTKQPDIAELANKLQQVRHNTHSKPDVIFVKYKTPEEAEHAQRTIQSKYEALDGPNHFNHQDIISTHNFVGSTGNRDTPRVHIDPRKSTISSDDEGQNSAYLPPAKKL